MFSASEVERYARHLVLRDVGGPGQQKLKAARVLVIGAGGLGSPVIQYLAAAGIGEIGILDDDVVSLSNLQRQVIFTTDDIGKRKTDCAAALSSGLIRTSKSRRSRNALTSRTRARSSPDGMLSPTALIISRPVMQSPMPAFTKVARLSLPPSEHSTVR